MLSISQKKGRDLKARYVGRTPLHRRKSSYQRRLLLSLLACSGLFFGIMQMKAAKKVPSRVYTTVVIGGVDYGTISNVDSLGDIVTRDDGRFTTVHLKRHYIADKPLADWAAKSRERAQMGDTELDDIQLIMTDESGREVGRYTLQSSSPLSWTQEASGSGGFAEAVDVAVGVVAVEYPSHL